MMCGCKHGRESSSNVVILNLVIMLVTVTTLQKEKEEKCIFSLTHGKTMQIVLFCFLFFRYPSSQRFLTQPKYNGGKENFVCCA